MGNWKVNTIGVVWWMQWNVSGFFKIYGNKNQVKWALKLLGVMGTSMANQRGAGSIGSMRYKVYLGIQACGS